jgi:hypothetical protein
MQAVTGGGGGGQGEGTQSDSGCAPADGGLAFKTLAFGYAPRRQGPCGWPGRSGVGHPCGAAGG